MIRTFVVFLGFATLLLAACAGTPTPTTRIEASTASTDRAPRNMPITLLWQAMNPGTHDGLPSCVLTRRVGDDPTETTLRETCTDTLTEAPTAPVTATTVHYDLKALRQPANATDPYLTQTISITLDPALFATRAGGTTLTSAIIAGRFVGAASFDTAIVTGHFFGTTEFGGSNLASAGETDTFVARIDPNGTWIWARSAGGTSSNDDRTYAQGVSVLADGGAIIAGYFAGSATFGNTLASTDGSTDVFVAQIGANGDW